MNTRHALPLAGALLAITFLSACMSPPPPRCLSCGSGAQPRPGLSAERVRINGDEEVVPVVYGERTAEETPATNPDPSRLGRNPVLDLRCTYYPIYDNAPDSYGVQLVLRNITAELPDNLTGTYSIESRWPSTADIRETGTIPFRDITFGFRPDREAVLTEITYTGREVRDFTAYVDIGEQIDTHRIACTRSMF
jgi:hypothetical protein